MKKICFIIGAGAEIPLGVSSGIQFAEAVLGLGEYDKYSNAIEEYYKARELDVWYPNYKNISWKYSDLLEAAIRKKGIDDRLSTKKSIDDIVRKEVDKSDDLKNLKKLDEYKMYISYMGMLDMDFYTLIYPKSLGLERFWRVVASYTRAYLHICENCKIISNDGYINALSDPCGVWRKLLEFANQSSKKENYYSVLRKHINKCSIITTNYTPFAERITHIESKKIAYVHGKLSLFECPRTMEIIDAAESNIVSFDDYAPKDIFFPYISIQSGVKPIIDARQINEYHKMITLINETDVIAILGYNLNSDDNHINSILRNAILDSNKPLTFFAHESEYDRIDAKEKIREIAMKLKLEDKNVLIECIPINNKNCFEKLDSFCESEQ